jgi:hypothetical protein
LRGFVTTDMNTTKDNNQDDQRRSTWKDDLKHGS